MTSFLEPLMGTGSQNRFTKCNLKKSCLKLKGPELSYLVYNII